jgi:ribose transport system permease protein
MSEAPAAAAVLRPRRAAVRSGAPIQLRFLAIWFGLLALVALGAIVVPRSLLPTTFLAIIPLAAFLMICAAGEALVIMSRGIDLSIPAVITLSSTVILGISAGRDADLFPRSLARFSSPCWWAPQTEFLSPSSD